MLNGMRGEDSRQQGPATRRPGWIISAAFLAVIVLVGVLVLVWPDDQDPDEPAASQTSTPTPTAARTASDSATPDAEASFCGLEPGDQTVPTVAPEGGTWEIIAGLARPSIEGIGPGFVDEDGMQRCFANSPTGALLAAMNAWAMGTANPDWPLELRLAADTPERLAQIQANEEGRTTTEGGGTNPQFRGFIVHDPDVNGDIFVELLVGEGDREVALQQTMRWEGGDWKLVVPPFGTDQLSDTDPSLFVSWRGV